jgi:AAHS family 4-hydroxybenzoate transporter-like MFS transporter
VRFLARQPSRYPELLRIARRLRPGVAIADDAEFRIQEPSSSRWFGFDRIMGDGLAPITLLLWICFACVLTTIFFMNAWLILLFRGVGLSGHEAAVTVGFLHIGGALGGIVISRFIDRFGYVAVALYIVIGIPLVAWIGMPGLSLHALMVLVGLAGFFVIGAAFGNNAASGLLYPTAVRSKGVGWALAAARVGSILGPALGGVLIARHVPFAELMRTATVPLLAGAIAAIAMARLCNRRFHGWKLDDRAAADL